MKKTGITAAVALTLVLGVGLAAGCSSESTSTWTGNDNLTEGAAPLMPPTHEGRYDMTGANGCYYCHGVNEDGEKYLEAASSMPDDHYEDSDPSTTTIDGTHGQCNTCHVQGYYDDDDEEETEEE